MEYIPLNLVKFLADENGNLLNPRKRMTLDRLRRTTNEIGMKDPIIVRINGDGFYYVVDGHQRVTLAREAKETLIRAEIQDGDPFADDVLESMIASGVKEPFSPLELAEALERLIATTQRPLLQVAAIAGLEVDDAQLHLDLLQAIPEVQKMVDSGKMSWTTFKVLRNQSHEMQRAALDKAKPKATGRVTQSAVRNAIRSVEGEATGGGMLDQLKTTHTVFDRFNEFKREAQSSFAELTPQEQYKLVGAIEALHGFMQEVLDNE